MLAFPIPSGQKFPTIPWKMYEYQPRKTFRGQNAGIIPYINGCIVVDLDFYKLSQEEKVNHPLWKIIQEQPKTLTVKTGSGGHHYYFQDDVEFAEITKLNKDNYDIIRSSAYVVAPGSYNSKTNDYYRIIENEPVAKMTSSLKQFILSQKHIAKPKKDKSTEYNFDISQEEIQNALDGLPKRKQKMYCDERKFWFKITVALKTLNAYEIWDKWSQGSTKYNKRSNDKIWNFIQPDPTMVFWLFKEAKLKYCGGHKKVLNKLKKQPLINTTRQYVDPNWFEEGINYMVKSDKGTGKSTAFLSFVDKVQPKKIISIVSRIALCREQVRKATEATFYEDYKQQLNEWKDSGCYGDKPNYDFLATTPESLVSVYQNGDEKDAVVFVDEFNSVLEHILTSSTMEKCRIKAFDVFIKILKGCKQFICADADISPLCELFLLEIGVNYQYIVNNYKPFKDISVSFHKDIGQFVDLIKQHYDDDKPFFVMTDSKLEAEACHQLLGSQKDIKLIMSKKMYELEDDDDDDIDLQNTKFMIASPKIVYGLDSKTGGKRTVFGIFKGHTISPPQMVQQLTRERQPHSIHIFYKNPSSKMPTYTSLNKAEELVKSTRIQYDDSEWLLEGFNESTFVKCIGHVEYIKDCYNTSRFHHLCNCLEESGFKVNNPFTNTKVQTSIKNISTEIRRIRGEKLSSSISEPKVQKYLSYYKIKGEKDFDQLEEIVDETCVADTECVLEQFLANEDYIRMYNNWKLLQQDYHKVEQKLTSLKDYESSKQLYNRIKSIEFCIRVMEYFGITINSLHFEPDNDIVPTDKAVVFNSYIKILNRWFNTKKEMTNMDLFGYFRKQLLKLFPRECFYLKRKVRGRGAKLILYTMVGGQASDHRPNYQVNKWFCLFHCLKNWVDVKSSP